MSTTSQPVAPWRAGIQGARANLVPGLVLQAFALALVLGYYFVPSVTEALARWTVWRDRLGVSYSMASTALFGAIIPWIYLRFVPATRHRYNVKQGFGLALFWAYKGWEMHWLYTGLAHFVGYDNSISTIAQKVVLDQFVYAPLLAAPGMWLGYQWVETHFNIRQVWAQFRSRGWFYEKLLPIMIANIGIWLPTVAIIYALPLPLQLPLENLVLCFFTLMLAHLSQQRATA
ncbi:hypothetical protein PXH66_21140 [Synoicihabitans lomoniglobus]|uniref:Uncharacterized protein n=2 Tax=Synoicihabitans lomoniglobus TaxID=2909285 RepID=A0AAE9ZXE4_9BACT|nr:hypothetical protein PXH66_21140 [Opitutaceae bacterium LMO-M01]